ISSRNATRPSSPFLGRVRSRTRPTNRVAEDESVEQADVPRAETSTIRSKDSSRSRGRGSSRYTPPTSKSRIQDVSTSSVPSPRYRERGRTTTSTTVSTITDSDTKRKYRRPNRVSSTESTKTNELDDSPIVRITQSRKRNSSLRSRSESNDEENNKVTNIKVFRRPTVNRELYDRTKQTKTNNAQEFVRKVNVESYHVASITPKVLGSSTSAESDKIEKNDLTNIVDQEVDSAVEANTIEPIYGHVKPVALIDITTASSNKIDGDASDRSDDAIATTTDHIEIHEFNPKLVIIVTEHAESTSEAPRRRKVIMRRRPISLNNTVEAEEEKRSEVFRRRRVIKRKRPLLDTSSPISTKVEEEALEDSSLFPESVIRDSENVEKSTIATDRTVVTPINKDAEELPVATGFTREMQDSTLAITEATLSTDFDLDDFTKTIWEIPAAETTISNKEATDSFSSAAISTINSYADEEYQSTSEINVEATTIESTLATDTIDNTESSGLLKETLVPEEPENLSTQIITTLSTSEPDSTRAQITTGLFTTESDSSRPSFESRYARKKFIRKNPVLFSGTNATPLATSSTENSNIETLSRRRNNFFTRRHPVSSTTANVPRDDVKYQEETQDINNRFRDLIEQEVAEDTTLKNKSVSADVLSDNFAKFWKSYTTTSSRSQISNSSNHIENIDDRKVAETEDTTYQSTSITTGKSEIRPRYKIPIILKRPFDPEEALSPKRYQPLDSASEESEETPETKETKLRQSSLRQPRTRYKLLNSDNIKTDEESTSNPEPSSTWQYFRTRLYSKRPSSTSTEAAVTETLIPAKKFDYTADAFHRKQQLLRTTTPRSNDPFDSQNLIDPDYTTAKPSVTRLVTSVTESGTTERQKILIKTKYSSLTSTTRIPADQFSSTTPISLVSVTGFDDESINEIRQGVERSTLPIESEFNFRYDGRFTTESQEPSTIEIESVFSNLIAGKSSAK
ncbi:uncharacterized protein, partial [Anoplolepis gracilipes]|uniref:uncharacterized protein n=1 Tax=Anoplolepis gracilipes TaxID=354296 RepID=UPI003BA240F3